MHSVANVKLSLRTMYYRGGMKPFNQIFNQGIKYWVFFFADMASGDGVAST
jgi:hypothetical protein